MSPFPSTTCAGGSTPSSWRSGLPGSTSLGKACGVTDALSFLRDVKRGKIRALSGRVAVLGGGNTAIDAAVTAKQLGAEDVFLVYRRSFAEMPAWPEERKRLLQSGCHPMILTQPLGYRDRPARHAHRLADRARSWRPKGDRSNLPRPAFGRCPPGGCFAQIGPVPFSRIGPPCAARRSRHGERVAAWTSSSRPSARASRPSCGRRSEILDSRATAWSPRRPIRRPLPFPASLPAAT